MLVIGIVFNTILELNRQLVELDTTIHTRLRIVQLYIMTWLQSTSTENFSILMHGMQSIERLCIPNVCFVPHAPRFEVRLHSEATCACHPPTCSEDVPFCAEQRVFLFVWSTPFIRRFFYVLSCCWIHPCAIRFDFASENTAISMQMYSLLLQQLRQQ